MANKVVLSDINIKDLISVLQMFGADYTYCIIFMNDDEKDPTFGIAPQLDGKIPDDWDVNKDDKPFEELGGEPFGLN